ncbi:hypothetical protein [Phenylobacterium sp.]|uniref:hypothetical protein n=1 Tax=Phenylobacterium sp. TaxID=1871053 RepID=UPI0025CEF538|nr:hypothetical protein [Phenylobacterium sp.]
MKPLYIVAASAFALTAAACGPKVPPVRAALDCPATQGDLTRTSVAPDGKTCTYATSGGAEVTLQLVNVTGSADATLAGIEKTLLADRTPAPESPPSEEKDAPAGEPAVAGSEAVKAAEKAAKEARDDTNGLDIKVTVDSKDHKGVVTDANGKTRVDLPGIHVVADDANDTADVQIGPLKVKANDDGATVRIYRDVRLRGEALNREKRGVRAMFIYTGEDLPKGYRFVGYEAGGPKRGPLTVAVVKSKSEGPDGHDIYPDVKKLVRKNGGV